MASHTINDDYLAKFMAGYVECALWSSTDDDDIPLDLNHHEIADEDLSTYGEECTEFVMANRELLVDIEPGQAGHDFWLTRNHHGAGFWDRGLDEVGDKLTEVCHSFGESHLYVGDDGKVHVE